MKRKSFCSNEATTKRTVVPPYQQGLSGEPRLPTLTRYKEGSQIPWQGKGQGKLRIANWIFHPYLVIMKSFPPPQSQSVSGDHVGAVNRCHAHLSQEGINRELMQSQIPTLFISSHLKCQWRLSGEPGILAIPGNMKAVPPISLLGCYQKKKKKKNPSKNKKFK